MGRRPGQRHIAGGAFERAQAAGPAPGMDAADLARLAVADAARASGPRPTGGGGPGRGGRDGAPGRGLADRIPVTDAEVAEASAQRGRRRRSARPRRRGARPSRPPPDADREAQAEKMARLTPVTDAEVARYGTPQPEAEPEAEPEAAADEPARPAYEAARDDIADLSAKVDQLAEQEAERRAEMDQAGIDEPVAHEPQAEPELESSWQPGDAQGYQEPAATADAEPEMEIG